MEKIMKVISGIKEFVIRRKIVSGIIVGVIVVGGYFGYQYIGGSATVAQYITKTATRGVIMSSISGAGQVSASDAIDLKPKVSGTVVSVKFGVGDTVKEGDLIAKLDTRDALNTVSEAKISLETAELDLQELLTDKTSITQAQNDVEDAKYSLEKLKLQQVSDQTSAENTLRKANETLAKAYSDAYTDLVNAFLDIPDVVTDVHDILFSNGISQNEVAANSSTNAGALLTVISSNNWEEHQTEANLIDIAQDSYTVMKGSYDASFSAYKTIDRTSDHANIENVLMNTITMTKGLSDTLKATTNMFDYWVSYCTDHNLRVYTTVNTYRARLSTYTSQTNSHFSTLTSIGQTIQNSKDSAVAAEVDIQKIATLNPLQLAQSERDLKAKEDKAMDLIGGPSEVDIKTKQLSVDQRRSALTTAQQALDDHYIYAPFDGIIAAADIKKGDEASSGTIIASLIGHQQMAEITLNEVDVAHVQVGQKAVMEFSAVEHTSVSGEVAEVDIAGSVSQGVVSYGVKIMFDKNNEQIKPGMSTDVTIITDSKSDVIIVPLSAVKTVRRQSTVQVLENGSPVTKEVTTGISNDTMVEIVSGLTEGEEVIVQTIASGSSAAAPSSSTQQSSIGGSTQRAPAESGDAVRQMRMLSR
ncbi:MAG: efflux RND transporter periplasmic adaptor subunit [bacterium]